MRVKNLRIRNFRAFDDLEINFDEKLTVFAGVNGVGKSTILIAISRMLSSCLPLISFSKEKAISFQYSDIKHGFKSYTNEIEILLNDQNVLSYLDSKDKHKAQPKEFQVRKEYVLYKYNALASRKKTDPRKLNSKEKISKDNAFAVYYNTQRANPDIPRTISDKGFSSQNAAYARALSGDRIQLRKSIELLDYLSKDVEKKNIVKVIKDSIKSILSEYELLEFEKEGKPSLIIKKEDETLSLSELSDGEKGIVAMVIDLARRLAIANPNCENPIKGGNAIVLIDEIELHLHPGWQRDIMNRLMTTFPNCQFIITTHSPQVLGEVEAKCIRYLYRGKEDKNRIKIHIPKQSFGLDSVEILEDLMGVSPINKYFEEKLGEVYHLIDVNKLEEASKILDELDSKALGSITRTLRPRVKIKIKSKLRDTND